MWDGIDVRRAGSYALASNRLTEIMWKTASDICITEGQNIKEGGSNEVKENSHHQLMEDVSLENETYNLEHNKNIDEVDSTKRQESLPVQDNEDETNNSEEMGASSKTVPVEPLTTTYKQYDQCLIYSKSQMKWVQGEIARIYPDKPNIALVYYSGTAHENQKEVDLNDTTVIKPLASDTGTNKNKTDLENISRTPSRGNKVTDALSPHSLELQVAVQDLKSQLKELEKKGHALEQETLNVPDYRAKYITMEQENQHLKLEQKKKKTSVLKNLVKSNAKRAVRRKSGIVTAKRNSRSTSDVVIPSKKASLKSKGKKRNGGKK